MCIPWTNAPIGQCCTSLNPRAAGIEQRVGPRTQGVRSVAAAAADPSGAES